MVFKTVDGHLSSIFNKVEKINTGFDLTNNDVQKLIEKFNNFNSQQDFGQDYEKFIKDVTNENLNVSLMFSELAEKGASAKASIEGVYAAILDGNTTGFANVKSTIELFNQAQQSGADNAKAFAKAVGQSNTQLGNYLGGLNGAKASLVGYGTQLAITTAKTIGLRAVTMALNVALSWGVSTVVGLLVDLFDKLVVTLNESREALADLKDEYSNLQSDILSVNNELKTTIDRMNELEKKDTLTFTEKEEYDNLVETNNELERKLALLELEEKQKKQEINKSFVDTMEKDVDKIGEYSNYEKQVTEKEYINWQFELRQKHYQNLLKAEQQYNNTKSKIEKQLLKKDKEYYQGIIDDIDKYLLWKNKSWTTDSEGIEYIKNPTTDDEKAVNKWLDFINDFQDKMAIAMGEESAKTNAFNRLVDNWQFDSLVQDLQDLGKQGRVTAEMLNDPKYGEFIQKLAEIGVIDATDNLNDIALAFNNSAKQAETATNKYQAAVSTTQELLEKYKDTFSNQDVLQKAFDKISEGTSLTADEVRELITLCPSLTDKFKQVADGYTISSQELVNANKEMTQGVIESLTTQKDELTKLLNNPISVNSASDAKIAQEYSKKIENQIDAINLILTMFGINVENTTDEVDKAFEKLSKSVTTYTKNQTTLNNAFKEQQKYGQLASDTIQSLIDAGYASALVIDKETGAVTLNASAVEALNNQKKFSLLLDAQKQKADLVKQLEDEKSKIDALTSSLMTSNEEKKKSYVADLLAAEANKEQIESQIAMYDALISSLDAPDFGTENKEDPTIVKQFKKDNEEKKHLLEMEQITEQEYYDWLDSESQRVYGNLADYQDELWKHEEEVYNWRQEQEQKLFDKKIDNLEKLADKALDSYKDGDGNELTVTASFDYAREQINKAIAETQARIDGIRNGTISGNTDDIETLIDDLETLNDKLIDINKKEIESEKDYISELKDDYSDMMDERIDKVDELSDKIEKSYDKQIDAIDKQIDELEKVKDTEDRIKKIKDAQLAVKEKEQALDDAKREDAKNNYVYFDGTGMSVQASNENQKKAQEELDQSKKDLEEAYRDEQINVLKDQKDILEEQKDTAKDYYDNVKDNLEKQKTQGEKTYEAVEKIYEKLGGDKKQTSSNTGLLRRLLFSGNISKAMSELSDTERQKAIDTGVVKVQPNGDYTFDYSAFAKYSSTVDNNTLATQDLTSILKEVVAQADADNKDKTNNSMVAGGFNLVADPKTGKLTKKQVMVNGEVVEGLGHKVNATSKEEWQEHNNSEKTSKGSFAGYDTFIDFMRAVSAGKVDISPLTNAFNSNYNPIVDKMNKSMSDTINNVSNSNVNNNINNKPVVNLTVNVEGSADKKTVEAFRNVAATEITNAFNQLNRKLDNTKI